MRFVAASASILSLALLMPAPGHCAIDEKVPDAQSLLALQTRASTAGSPVRKRRASSAAESSRPWRRSRYALLTSH